MMNTTISGAAEPSPTTEKKPVIDMYHGVKVTDEYRWLEESGAVRVKEWTRGQSEFARRYFDRLEDRVKIESQLTALYAEDPPSYGGLVARSGRLFALKFQPPKQQRLLVSFRSFGDLRSEKVVLDPNEIAPKGQVSMDWF
ncbi:MAG: S9 family peptidase, partial [Verrucomicrobia bacterium]|nr:S9 family peptidase [Verrucomicrobiota bacterium]